MGAAAATSPLLLEPSWDARRVRQARRIACGGARDGRTIATGSHAKSSSCQAVSVGAAPPTLVEPSAKKEGASTASLPAAPDQLGGIASWSMTRDVSRSRAFSLSVGRYRMERGRALLTVPRYDQSALRQSEHHRTGWAGAPKEGGERCDCACLRTSAGAGRHWTPSQRRRDGSGIRWIRAKTQPASLHECCGCAQLRTAPLGAARSLTSGQTDNSTRCRPAVAMSVGRASHLVNAKCDYTYGWRAGLTQAHRTRSLLTQPSSKVHPATDTGRNYRHKFRWATPGRRTCWSPGLLRRTAEDLPWL